MPIIERRAVGVGEDGVLRATVDFSLAHPDRTPVRLVDEAGQLTLDPRLTEGLPHVHPYAVGDPLLDAQAQLQLEEVDSHTWWYPEGELTPVLDELTDGGCRVMLTGEIAVDPATAADSHPLPPGRYAVWFTGQLLGISRRRRLVMPKAAQRADRLWRILGAAPIAVRPDWSASGAKLHLEVRDRQEWIAEHLTPRRREASSRPRPGASRVELEGRLPTEGVPVSLAVGDRPVTAHLLPAAESGRATLRLPEGLELPPGRHPATVAGAFRLLPDVQVGPGTAVWATDDLAASPAPATSLLRRALRRLRS